MLTHQWLTAKPHGVTRHYLPSDLLLLEMMGPARGQLKVSKLQTCKLKANRRDSRGVFKLVKSKSTFLKADSKMKKSFCGKGTAFFYRNLTTLCATKLKNSGSQIRRYTTLDFTVKGITSQLDLTWIWRWYLLSYKRLLCSSCQVWSGKKK